jgi:uncharacterized membrane protein YdbT with pleckstrin-like domain
VIYLVIGIMDFSTCGVAKVESYYTIRYSLGFTLHTVVIPANKIVEVQFRQGVFQQIAGTCDLLLYTRTEGRMPHRCRSLPLAEAENILRNEYYL